MSSIIKTGQVMIPASAIGALKLIGANPLRRRILIQLPATTSVYIGESAVSASLGFLYGSSATAPLSPLELNVTTELWLFPASAAALTVTFLEESA